MTTRTLSTSLPCWMGLWLVVAGSVRAQEPIFEETTADVPAASLIPSRSTAFGDYNNDGLPDQFLASNNGQQIRLLLNSGAGGFFDRAPAIQGAPVTEDTGGGAVWGDYDNDGDLDLFVPVGAFGTATAGVNVLLRNDRGQFVDVAMAAGLVDRQPTDNALWLDYDRDGYLDLYTGNLACNPPDPSVRNLLYRNNGNGTFVDVTTEASLDVLVGGFSDLSVGDCAGGSNGGMTADDVNGDGWPDLYLASFLSANRLFLNTAQGGFSEAPASDLGDEGEAFGVAVGDIDNDMDLDLFFAAGGSLTGNQRSAGLLNVGGGQFVDATSSMGLQALTSSDGILGINLADVDNDGDLDLLAGWSQSLLFLNDGMGIFSRQTSDTGLRDRTLFTLSVGDMDLDGFLDIVGGGGGVRAAAIFRNRGNGNHWLRVELTGTDSNRNGIGARVTASSGGLRQMREVLGGLGFYQNEMVAHFGLGERTQVDTLMIQWPSGQTDTLTSIPADQKIRVIEGASDYHVVKPTTWSVQTDSIVTGTTTPFSAVVRPATFDRTSEIVQVTADLSDLGGPRAAPLTRMDDESYELDLMIDVGVARGLKSISVSVDQNTQLGPYWVGLTRDILVLPDRDLPVYTDHVASAWALSHGSVGIDDRQSEVVFAGEAALAVHGSGGFAVRFEPIAPFNVNGYESVRFAFHPGNVTEGIIAVDSPGSSIVFQGEDFGKDGWREVELSLPPSGAFRLLIFSGAANGTFYLDDIRLVPARTSEQRATAVVESQDATVPQSFTLSQNYPNPFNPETTIRFDLPRATDIDLALYNLVGQKVASLAQGPREAGAYALRWDGRGDDGKELGSGVYLYRLTVGARAETRKLLLLR